MGELERAVDAVVVGERERRVAELGRPRGELLRLRRPVEKRVRRVAVQLHIGHTGGENPRRARRPAALRGHRRRDHGVEPYVPRVEGLRDAVCEARRAGGVRPLADGDGVQAHRSRRPRAGARDSRCASLRPVGAWRGVPPVGGRSTDRSTNGRASPTMRSDRIIRSSPHAEASAPVSCARWPQAGSAGREASIEPSSATA